MMSTLPAPHLLLSVFAKVKHFGLMADSPAGLGYLLDGLTVAVGFYGDRVYFFYQSAVLVLSNDTQLRFEQNNNPDNPLLLEKVSQRGCSSSMMLTSTRSTIGMRRPLSRARMAWPSASSGAGSAS